VLEQPLTVSSAPGHRVEVRVEAEGFGPAEPIAVEFTAETPEVRRQVYLAPLMRFTGVELRVRDAAQRPIPHLNVTARRLVAGAGADAGADAEPRFVWSRTAAAADGNYRLPELGPGVYSLEIVSVDAAGEPTYHVPHTERVEYGDGQHIITPVTLAYGAMVELTATDGQGRTIGTDVRVELVHPDGERHRSIWQPLLDGKPDREATLGVDKLVRDAPARLYRCVAPGRYTLTARWGQGPPRQRVLDLVLARQPLPIRDYYQRVPVFVSYPAYFRLKKQSSVLVVTSENQSASRQCSSAGRQSAQSGQGVQQPLPVPVGVK
jgi:hypothetical protein